MCCTGFCCCVIAYFLLDRDTLGKVIAIAVFRTLMSVALSRESNEVEEQLEKEEKEHRKHLWQVVRDTKADVAHHSEVAPAVPVAAVGNKKHD